MGRGKLEAYVQRGENYQRPAVGNALFRKPRMQRAARTMNWLGGDAAEAHSQAIHVLAGRGGGLCDAHRG